MYLDTDILLAVVKPEDWLKPHINLKKFSELKTSVFAIVEAELILEREYGRNETTALLEKIKKAKIKIESITEAVIEKNLEFLQNYPKLTIFDSVHAGFCYTHGEKILSTDHIYDSVKEIERIDPRNL